MDHLQTKQRTVIDVVREVIPSPEAYKKFIENLPDLGISVSDTMSTEPGKMVFVLLNGPSHRDPSSLYVPPSSSVDEAERHRYGLLYTKGITMSHTDLDPKLYQFPAYGLIQAGGFDSMIVANKADVQCVFSLCAIWNQLQ